MITTFEIFCVSFIREYGSSEWHLPLILYGLDGRKAVAEVAVLDTNSGRLTCLGAEFNFVAMVVGHEGTCVAIHTTAPHRGNVRVKFYTRIPTPGTSAEKALEHSARNIENGLFWKGSPRWVFNPMPGFG